MTKISLRSSYFILPILR